MTEKYNISKIDFQYETTIPNVEKLKITCSKEAVNLIRPYFEEIGIETKESAFILFTNRQLQVIAIHQLSIGGLAATVVDIKFIIILIAQTLASNIFFFHNHPSGNCKPSKQDILITKKIKEIATLIDSNLSDSIILMPDERYYSFADSGMI